MFAQSCHCKSSREHRGKFKKWRAKLLVTKREVKYQPPVLMKALNHTARLCWRSVKWPTTFYHLNCKPKILIWLGGSQRIQLLGNFHRDIRSISKTLYFCCSRVSFPRELGTLKATACTHTVDPQTLNLQGTV